MINILFLTFIIGLSSCQRRITNSSSVDHRVNTHFLVSIVSARTIESIKGWLCGGTIIHPTLVLTAASCLHTTPRIYVIAGYRHYVRTEDLESNTCTRHMKKRIIHYCLHSEYGELRVNKGDKHTSEERKHKWTIFDIGIARTETPFDFYDPRYTKYCSYLPNAIKVNFHRKHELPESDAVVYGWGHAEFYRPNKDKTDYNQDTIRFTSTRLMDSKECQNRYKSRYLKAQINTIYLCTDDRGSLDAYGRNVIKERPRMHSCSRRSGSLDGLKFYDGCNNGSNIRGKEIPKTRKNVFRNTRRNGICQNDHGSPLIRWIGGHPYVIGVASAFQVNKNMECVGPYLFTSTRCTSRFIHCVLSLQNKQTRRSSICDVPDSVRGFKLEETFINWNDDNTATTEADYDLYDSIESNGKT